ncbi:MAG: pantoate--beta-alanine ligase [Polyangiales bacterium]
MSAPTVIHAPAVFRARCERARRDGLRVGFVPTMGALHEGHLTLAREARRRVGDNGLVTVSIFVNPTQFGPNEDFSRYPRELDADVARCATAGVDVVFAPAADEMYPPGDQTRVRVPRVAEPLCGPHRPGHFEGVATVVARLFSLSGACVAVFGRKDYQQWRLLDRMARDLFMPVEVVGHATVREPDGLAMSSRNRYLSAADRARARAVPEALSRAAHAYARGERDVETLRALAEEHLRAHCDAIDYVDLREPVDLEALPATLAPDQRAVIATAVRIGATRLIDNVVLGEEPAPISALQ